LSQEIEEGFLASRTPLGMTEDLISVMGPI
jgi:hypothetical protein